MYLRSHVLLRPAHRGGHWTDRHGVVAEAKIGQSAVASIVQQDVSWLQIPA